MQSTAEWIASHALTLLILLTFVMVLATAALWRVTANLGPRFIQAVLRICSSVGQHRVVHNIRSTRLVKPALARTLSAGKYLGIHALLSFAVALLCVTVFVELAAEIGIDDDLARFDLALSQALAVHLSPHLLRLLAIVTHLGDQIFLTVLVIVVAATLVARREYLLAAAWTVATAAGGLLTWTLKAYFERTRPIHNHGFASEDGWSFPSGHASGSMMVYGLLGYLIVRHTPARWHIPVTVGTMILIVFIGSSRVLLQVHFFSDVLGGWAIATAWTAFCVAGLEVVRRRRLGNSAARS